jgi:excisionase family DNA binding protein
MTKLRGAVSPLLTLNAAAKFLGCDPRTLRVAIERKQIPAIEFGKRIMVPRKAVRAFAMLRSWPSASSK